MKSITSIFKISIFGIFIILLSGFYPTSLSAQVLTEDNCDRPRALDCGITDFGTTEEATVSAFPNGSCAVGSLKDVFYSFTAFPGYTYTITVNGTNYDGVLQAFKGGCDNPTEIACADNGFADNIAEVIQVSVTYTQNILVRTYDYNSNGGNYALKLVCESSGNDLCNNANEILAGNPLVNYIVVGSTVGASSSSTPNPSCSAGSMNDVFYKLKAYPGLDYTIKVNGTNYDGVLAAYTGTCGGTLNQIACADAGYDDNIEEIITFSVDEEQYVVIQTFDYDESGGDFKLYCRSKPNNNSCADATELNCGDDFLGKTYGATASGIELPSCNTFTEVANDVFYTVDAQPGKLYQIVSTPLLNWRPRIVAYSGFNGLCGGNLTEIACTIAPNSGQPTVLEFSVLTAQTILIRNYDVFNGGEYRIALNCLPQNNDCENAIPIACGSSVNGTTLGATESDIPLPGCVDDFSNPADVFYSLEAEPNVTYTATVQGANYDAIIAAYTGDCDGELDQIACADNGTSDGIAETISFSVESAQTVLIRTYDWFGNRGDFTLSIACESDIDECSDAVPIECGSEVIGSTYGATESGIPQPECGSGTPADVFYSLEAQPNITYTATINGANYDAVIAAYIGECDGTLTELACADNGLGTNIPETMEFSIESAQTVLIRTYDWFSNRGAFTLSIDCEAENATCENAIPINVSDLGDCPANAVIGNNASSSTTIDNCDSDNSEHTVFYTFNSGDDHVIQISFAAITITDYIVQVLENCSGTYMACDIGGNEITFPVTQNTDYSVSVSTNTIYGDPGSFSICITGLGDFCPYLGDDIGQPCDDGNPETTNDIIQENCTCAGSSSGTIFGHVDWNSSCGSRNGYLQVYLTQTNTLVGGYNVTVNSDGEFNIQMSEVGVFDFIIKVEGYLSSAIRNVNYTNVNYGLYFGIQKAGDLNGSNSVNFTDISVINLAYGSTNGDTNYNKTADYNCNGNINIADISIINASFGQTGATAPLAPL